MYTPTLRPLYVRIMMLMVVLVASFGLWLGSAQAAVTFSPAEQLSMIQNLLDQIEALKKQLAMIRSAETGGACVSLNLSTSYRAIDAATSNEVSTLQKFLYANGYLAVAPTGFFGVLTEAAVKSFQKAQSIEATGIVGEHTRAKIKELTCVTEIPETSTDTEAEPETDESSDEEVTLSIKTSFTGTSYDTSEDSSGISTQRFEYDVDNWKDGYVLDVEPKVNCDDTYTWPRYRECEHYIFDISMKGQESYEGVKGNPFVKGGASYRFTGSGHEVVKITSYPDPDHSFSGNEMAPKADGVDFTFIIRDSKGNEIWSKEYVRK